MSDSKNKSDDFAARALECLEQAYAYYSAPFKNVTKAQAESESETYYEYVKAA